MHLVQRQLFAELSAKSKRGKFALFLPPEISKVRVEITRCSVALGKEQEMKYNYFGYNLFEKRDCQSIKHIKISFSPPFHIII